MVLPPGGESQYGGPPGGQSQYGGPLVVSHSMEAPLVVSHSMEGAPGGQSRSCNQTCFYHDADYYEVSESGQSASAETCWCDDEGPGAPERQRDGSENRPSIQIHNKNLFLNL